MKKDRKIDYLGAITFTIGISTLLYALLNAGPGQKYAWNSASIYILFAVALVFIALFGYIETKVKEPMLPHRYFGFQLSWFPISLEFCRVLSSLALMFIYQCGSKLFLATVQRALGLR